MKDEGEIERMRDRVCSEAERAQASGDYRYGRLVSLLDALNWVLGEYDDDDLIDDM